MGAAQYLTPEQAWRLSVRNAVDQDRELPTPPGTPPMSQEEFMLWQTHVKQSIHYDMPITPKEWLLKHRQRR
jgi:hypothetical protein